MIKKILKNSTIKILPEIFCLFLFVVGISLVATNNPPSKKPSTSSVVKMEPIYVADFSNDKILMGASHNVFVGKVLEQVGTKERGIGPETQFKVEVIENIKGDLKGEVTIDQQGGYKDGVLYVTEDNAETNVNQETFYKEGLLHMTDTGGKNSYLLQPGSTYLFATRYNKKENWYTLNSFPTANKLLSSKVTDSNELKNLAESDVKVQALKEAYKKEVLLEADVKSNNTLNSYKSVESEPVKE